MKIFSILSLLIFLSANVHAEENTPERLSKLIEDRYHPKNYQEYKYYKAKVLEEEAIAWDKTHPIADKKLKTGANK